MVYTANFPIEFQSQAQPKAIVQGSDFRITVLTSRLFRLEYDPTGAFEDRPSQTFWYRAGDVPDFQIDEAEDLLKITTEHMVLLYKLNTGRFADDTLQIYLKDNGETWHFGDDDPQNLGGTARTLDEANGAIPLESGLVSRRGWAVVDDSQALVFDQDGWLVARTAHPTYQDLYFFGYESDYQACLREFLLTAGAAPLPPRFALGIWWSRYWAYSADELLELMARFKAERIPLSVCIVDMDWHITATGNESSGWTGYTWNRDLFPDPASFLKNLHGLGLKTALNLHPAEGIHPHEDRYEQFAQAIGTDPETQAPIPFDIANPEFVRAYFEFLHHPQESAGVDFWWLDWQQGTQSQMQGLDPLWWLNHLHYYDLGRDGQKRPFIFSRWGGLGSHRYPIGFSGDSVVSWESLAFQPYFTSTAANVGFGWWSHDIGGHMGGVEDPELYTRWVQFGVFSPILRMHSTNNPFHERRPWGYDAETLRVNRAAMQLRHALVPYIYSMAWRFNQLAQPLIRPMYHNYPDNEQAYLCPNQYTFGSELIAAPCTTPREESTRLSRQVVWLPPGEWFNFFNGSYIDGDAWHALYSGLDEIPVFAKAGAIVPLAQPTGEFGTPLPEAFEVHLFPGADNTFELYEDDDQGKSCITPMTVTWTDHSMLFELGPAAGEFGHLPPNREFTFHLHNVTQGELRIARDNQRAVVAEQYDDCSNKWVVGPLQITPAEKLRVELNTRSEPLMLKPDHRLPMAEQLLRNCRLDSYLKWKLQERLESIAGQPGALGDIALMLEGPLLKALLEIMGGAGIHTYRHPIDDQPRILCWNNRGHPSVTIQLAGLTRWGDDLVSWSGVIPSFAAVVPTEKGFNFILGHLGDSQEYEEVHLPVEAWRMAVDYYSVLRVNYDSETL